LKKSEKSGQDDNAKESKRILDRVARDSETVATSTMARTSDQFKNKVGDPDDDNDPIEVLGKKIGRSLGWVALAVLGFYMLNTYVF